MPIVSLLVVAVVAKTLVLLRHVWHHGTEAAPLWQGPLSLAAFFGEDVLLVAIFAAGFAGAGFLARGHRIAGPAVAWVQLASYFVAAFWMALNVPVFFVLGSPLTFALLHAADGALSDSIARYLSPGNLAALLLVVVLAALLPRWGRRGGARFRAQPRSLRRSRWLPVWIGSLAFLGAGTLIAGPAAITRIETRGLHRNAVVALVATTARRSLSAPDLARPPALWPACAARDDVAPAVNARAAPPVLPSLSDRSIVWIILESAGARHLGAYGALRAATPHLSALADQAVVFERAYAAYPESIKGLFSMLCARPPPPESEAADYAAGRLPCAPVAAAFRRAGFRTGLFHAGRFAYLGMQAVVQGRGFDVLADAATITSRFASSFGVDEPATVDAVLRFVDQAPGRPFFAVYMPIAGHHPYHAPGDGPRPFPERSSSDEHRNDLFVADAAVGRLRAGLQARGLDDKTLYLVVGDHGEAFDEHPGNIAHALHLYEENVHVPLFFAAPGAALVPQRLLAPVSVVDLAPTLAQLAGLPPLALATGQSLLPTTNHLHGQVVRFSTEQAMRRAGLVDGRYKFLLDRETNRAQLFDLHADPGERHDRAADHPALVAHYRGCLATR